MMTDACTDMHAQKQNASCGE